MNKLTIMMSAAIPAAMLAAVPAQAQSTKTVTIDTPKYEGTKVITRDKEAGTKTGSAELIRKEDGAVATRNWERQRTENGFTRNAERTNFNGETATGTYERVRTDNGWDATGQRVRSNGDVFDYQGQARRGPNGFAKREKVTKNGEPVAGRKVQARRTDDGYKGRKVTKRRTADGGVKTRRVQVRKRR